MEKKLKHKFDLLRAYGRTEDGVEESHRIELCLIAMNTLIYLSDKRESILPYSFEKFGQSLEEYLNNDSNLTNDVSYLICATFLKEYYLYRTKIDTKDVESSDVYRIWDDFKELPIPISDKPPIFNNEFYKELKRDDTFLDSIYFCLSIQDSKFNIKNSELEEKRTSYLDELKAGFDDLNIKLAETKKVLNTEMGEFSEKIKSSSIEVKTLASQLKEQKTAFNFVGLSKGFEKLLSQKRWSKWTSFGIMSVFCVLLIALPIVIIGGRFFNWFAEYNIEWSKIGWEQMLPILGLELVFIYFFRVALTHYNSIQTQIMQLELRQSLCQFIQSYADYAKEIKEKDGASLEKFENLIFSSILSTPDKVPSTFDGLEQLSNFIKELKK
ncbi:hypothetical protein [Actinobacillus equuli]|uniref:hypothetical protein n=1 Tax=Actinobacillus equuli TaxID=718 RepID=UPI00244294C1|nr:hypothetical protein [Actinobacillus equuli]WGE52974.1 hypothetical protein NYR69_11220 [Actinobacillus equuli subsp. haemolyticus]